MGLAHSPKIATDGLVFAYDMGNSQKSWKGAPITNLAAGRTSIGNNNVPTTTVITTKPNGQIGEVQEHSAETISDVNRTVSIGSWSLTSDIVYTLSFYVKNLSCSGFNGNLYSPTSNVLGGIAYPTIFTDRWTRVTRTFTVPSGFGSAYTFSPQLFRDGGLGKFRLTDVQLEQNSFATPYINGTRSNTQAVLDLMGNNTITANNLTYNNNGSFSFNGTTNFISFGNSASINSIGGTSNIAVEAWVRYNSYVGNGGATTYSVVTHKGTPWTWLMENPSNKGRIRFTIGGADVSCADTDTHPLDTWIHWIGTYDGSNIKFYSNGILKNTVARTGLLGSNSINATIGEFSSNYRINGDISMIKIYNRALTEQEVQQNFNALRTRYGV